MESQRLNKIAQKFWKGEASEQEEQELKQSLSQMEGKAELKDLRAYQEFLKEEADHVYLDETFDEQILTQIQARPSRPLFSARVFQIAAVVLVLLALAFSINQVNRPLIEPVKISVNKEPSGQIFFAYQEVKKALFTLSGYLNDAMAHASTLGAFHEIQEELKTNQINKKEYESK